MKCPKCNKDVDMLKFTKTGVMCRDCHAAEPSAVEVRIALNESVKLQAHYAKLLNQWDGGERMIFQSAEAWIARLRETGTLSPNAEVSHE